MAQEKKFRVLFAGCGIRMIENLMEHIPDRYQSEKCATAELDFVNSLEKFRPHTVVVCLQNETREALKSYYILEDNPKYVNLPIVVIGKDDDCELFRKKVVVKDLEILERPLDMEHFLNTLDRAVVRGSESEVKEEEEDDRWSSKVSPAQLKEKHLEQRAVLSGRKSILVVDDDVRMLNVIKMYLQDLYDVTVVPSGKLALKFLSKKHADLVLLDYLMPEMDGPAVLELIRTTAPEPNIPVLFLTGVSDKDMVMKTLELSPSGYLLKPATREVILEKVTEILLCL